MKQNVLKISIINLLLLMKKENFKVNGRPLVKYQMIGVVEGPIELADPKVGVWGGQQLFIKAIVQRCMTRQE